MTTDYHAEFSEEEAKLNSVAEHIDNEINRIQHLLPATAWHQETAETLQRMNQKRLREFKEARPRPFFGRVDFIRAESPGKQEAHYLGIHAIDGLVTDWRAPIASLFFDPAGGKYLVKNHDGVLDARNARVHLKRTYTIEDSTLYEFLDSLRLSPGSGPPKQLTDPTLTHSLERTGDSSLGEVVATLQPSQYEQIASIDRPVMIIQGAAGSGKSLVGLHRLAYLLSPHNRLETPLNPRNVVMLGPSRAFLKYVRGLLPSLGEHNIRQMTVDDWVMSQFTKRPRIDGTNRLLHRLMGNRNPLTEAEIRAELFKGSTSMASLLNRYVRGLREKETSSVKVESVLTPFGARTVNPVTVRRIIRSTNNLPLNAARETFITRFVRELWAVVNLSGNRFGFPRFEAIVRKDVEAQISQSWRQFDFVEVYLQLLEDPMILIEMGKGMVDNDLAIALNASRPRLGRPFQSTDAPALLYLDHLLNAHSASGFEHVVVDEAQEVAPIEIRLLKLHSRNGWFTILGDLPQRTLSYKGIDSWQELRPIFGTDYSSPLNSRTSYRPTVQITRFANRILRRIRGNTLPPPQPYGREGDRPKLHRSASVREMYEAIAQAAHEYLNRSMTVAIMTRTTYDANQVMAQFRRSEIKATLLTPDGEIEENLTVSPILLTKGLEFDAVIIAGVDSGSFTGSDMDNRLLYLASTRARHFLEIHWAGTPSPLIANLGASGTVLGGELEGRRVRSIFRRPRK